MKRFVLFGILAASACVLRADDATKSISFTCSGYQGRSALADFPVLVRLSPAIAGFDYADFGGTSNLVFRDSSGNILPHEIDTWDSEGESLVWVRIPSLTAQTAFTMFYCGETGEENSPANVWTASGYIGVWHMSEESGAVADSSGHALAATPAEDSSVSLRYTGTDAPSGAARQTGTSSKKGYLSVPNYDSLAAGSTFTVSGWVRLTEAVSNSPRLFSRKDSYSSSNGWEVEMATASDANFNIRGAARDKDTCKGTFSPSLRNRWTHLAFVYNGDSCSVYTNGFELMTGTITPATDNGLALSIGCDSDGSEANIRGAFDECRLRDAVASADWVAAEYATVASRSFVVADAVQDLSPAAKDTLGSFSRRVTFAVVHEGASGEMPVLVRLAANDPAGFVYADCAPGGGDIRFAGADGTPIPFEIDTWNPEGESLVWVKAPSIAPGAVFTMYYKGTPAVANAPGAVWSSYTGVWHFGELGADTTAFSQGVYSNSTARSGLDAHLSVKSIANESGRFGKAFKVNGSTGWKQGDFNEGGAWVPDSGADSSVDTGAAFTISGWFKHENWNYNYGHLFFKRLNANNSGETTGAFATQLGSGSWDNHIDAYGSGDDRVRATTSFSLKDIWVHLSFVFDGQTHSIYVNGERTNYGTYKSAVVDNDAPLVFGNNVNIVRGETGDCAWPGWIDEVRYTRTAMSATDIAAEYAAMAQAGFIKAGEVERIGMCGMIIIVR